MKEALKLALEALETCCAGDYSTGHVIDPSFDEDAVNEAITAIKEALAQPEQEPVAHFGSAYVNENGVHVTTVLGPVAIPQDAKLYTAPPERPWVGLTDEQREACTQSPFTEDNYDDLEAKLKELNT